MPTYTVTAPAGRLTGAQKATLAHEITRTHNKHTGAQTFFAQVMFVDFLQGNWFVGGVPIDQEQIFLHGQVRSGRPPEVKEALLKELAAVVANVSKFPIRKVWGYLAELPPAHMMEYGHILPEPGTEAAWLAALPAEDRRFMESLAR